MTDDPLRHALLTARVPRYTSYPPADRFTAAVGGAEKTAWLGAIAPGSTVSLYVHVPFCRRLCWFCACRTQGTRSDAPLDRYLDHLAREIAHTRVAMPERVAVSALHLGGGTPTLLSPDRIGRLGRMIARAFDLSGAEVSAEIDPTECDTDRIDALVALGLVRASVGVQDFDQQVQAAIGRAQSSSATWDTMRALRRRGIGSVNFDLLYGLPHQDRARLRRTIDTVLAMAPDRIALYGYAHVPWVARRQKLIPEDALPSPEQRLALAEMARDALLDAGYVAVGIDHFALPHDTLALAAQAGTLRRNFQGYTTDTAETLVGFGPSAISRFAQGYVQNASATDAWQQVVEAGAIPAARGIALSDLDRTLSFVVERLMCDGAVDLGRIGQPVDPGLGSAARAALDLYPGAGAFDGTVLRLFDPRAARLVAHAIETALKGAPAPGQRYSQAS
ncbi:oxygen-independent coproporphyrinogen III oxidase [Citreimonas sp.]|uniref:oxygen-independent coproporphyrinogen III oxidase n=1 Tax=Citreimonas sp. TaxID=3036715 RepID=UPI00405A4099